MFAVDVIAAQEAERDIFVRSGNSEEYRAAMAAADKTIGRFEAVLAEERATTRSFPLPGTDLVVTATVFYTDESLPLTAASMSLGVAVGKRPVPNAIADPTAALAEVDLEIDTFIVRVKKGLLIDETPWIVGLQCQTMTNEARQQQLRESNEK